MGGTEKGKDNLSGNTGEHMTSSFPVLFSVGWNKLWYWNWRDSSHEMTADRENVNPTNKKEPGSVIVRNITLALDHLPLGGKKCRTKISFYLVSQLLFSVFYHCSQAYSGYKSECSIWLFLINTVFLVYHFLLLSFSTLCCLWLKNNWRVKQIMPA